ncbi:hypothetical protein ACHCPG_002554 [Enterococcus hirae]
MKNKHLRIITTSLLLFQNCLYPLTVFAEEAPPEVDTEFVQDLQNQGEQPVTQETGLPETATNDSTVEVEENIEEIVDEAPVVDEVPIVEEQEVKEIPTEIPNEPSTEVTEPVIPFEDPVPPILRQSAGLRNNLPNLDEYRPYLVAYGKKHYIDETLTNAIGREITLAATVGSKNSFTVSVPTFQKVMQENDHGWISWIASNLSTADDYPYDTMYYGNTAAGGTYELTIPSDQSVNGYQVTITKPSITLFTATFDVTITRLALSSVKEEKLTLNGNVKLGTVAIASQFPQLPRVPIEDVSYDNALLGTITIKNEQPDPAIKSEVTVEAQREKDLSEDVLKSWFSILPEDSGNYDYSLSSGPTEWAPGATGQATVTIKNKTTNNTRRFTTTYTVVDTTAPKFYTIQDAPLEARRKGSLTDEEVRSLFQKLEDNWSEPKDLQIELLNNYSGSSYIPWEIKESGPGYVFVTIRVTDQAGNASVGSNYRFRIVDTTPPDGKLKESLSYEQGSETPDLRELLDGDPTDNWSWPEDITPSLTFANGKEFSELPVGEHEFTLTLTDESGNQKELTGKLSIRQSFVIKSEVTVEAQREKDLSEDVLKSWFSILPEESEDSGDYDYSLSSGPTEWAPDTTGTATVSVTNKETNDTREFTTRYTVVDTTPPEGKLKDSLVYEQGSETPDLRELLDGDPTDNWSWPEDITPSLTFANGKEFSELPVGEHEFTLTLTDEFNNEIKLKGTFVITPNKQYIDVTIPTRMSFIQETALASIISPNYQIQNNSIRPVEVYVDSMTSLEQTERLTELTLGIQHIDRDQEVLLVSKGQNLSESVELVTLTSEQNTYEFSLFGAAGDNIQSEILDAPIRPSYLMGLHFKIQ